MGDIAALLTALTLAHDRVADLKVKREAADAGSTTHDALTEEVTAAETDHASIRQSIVELTQQTDTTVEPVKTDPLSNVNHNNGRDSPRNSTSTRYTARVTEPGRYTTGQNFTIWCSRFKRFLKYGKIPDDDSLDILLNNVDDKTVELLEPVADRMTETVRSSPSDFIPLLEQAFYPKGEVRGLRQEMMSGGIKQLEDEDIDQFASRIRTMGRRAYSNSADREEPCLNAFLNGIFDEQLYNMIIGAHGTQDDFETAVTEARKFEKLRRKKKPELEARVDEAINVFGVERGQNSADTPRQDRSQPEGSRREYSRQPDFRSDYRPNHREYRPDQRNYRPNTRYNDRPSRPADRPDRSSRICYRCDRPGHISRFCPENPLNSQGVGSNPGPSTQ